MTMLPSLKPLTQSSWSAVFPAPLCPPEQNRPGMCRRRATRFEHEVLSYRLKLAGKLFLAESARIGFHHAAFAAWKRAKRASPSMAPRISASFFSLPSTSLMICPFLSAISEMTSS